MSERSCPGCRRPMKARFVGGVEIDECPACGGVFLDPGETDATGINSVTLFGESSRPAGISDRCCPADGEAMVHYQIRAGDRTVQIERCRACGGVYFDAGEHAALTAWIRSIGHAPRGRVGGFVGILQGVTQSGPPPGFAPSAVPSARPSGPAANDPAGVVRTCPRCQNAMQVTREGDVELDRCTNCGGVFVDFGEMEARGVDTAALFGTGPEGLQSRGPSALQCPACQRAMAEFLIETLAGPLLVERAECCGGFFLDGGEDDAFARAARIATTARADREFAAGKEVTPAALGKKLSYLELRAQWDAHAAAKIRGVADRALIAMIESSTYDDDEGFFDEW